MGKPMGHLGSDLGAIREPEAATTARISAEAQALQPWLVELRRHFHRHPETGWREIATTARIVEELTRMGYRTVSGKDFLGEVPRLGLSRHPIPHEGETGCIAIHDTGRPGPTVCLRVDIDALPITEAGRDHFPADAGFASTVDGVMHSCGHDGHIAIGLGVARLLAPMLAGGCGKVKLLFQPAEEGARGAASVVAAGWMEDVDLFVAVHLGLGVASGTVAFGVHGFLASRKYTVELTGRSAHAGKTPEEGRNALLAACQMVPALHALAQSSAPGIRVNVGVLEAGKAANIVPEKARLEVEIRAGANEDLERLAQRCLRLIAVTAEAHEVACTTTLRGTSEAWRNPDAFVRWACAVGDRLGTFPSVLTDHAFGASEDATALARVVDGRGGMAGIVVLGADLAGDHHTPGFDFDEDALWRGVQLLTALVAGAMQIPASGAVS